MIIEVLLILFIVNLIQNLNPYVFYSSMFNFCTFALPFKYNCKLYMLISCTFTSLVKSNSSSSTVTFKKFTIIIKYDCNCTMLTCCTFASLVKSNFNYSMATSFTFTPLATFGCNPSMVISCTGYYHLFYFSRLLN
jgi:hypothetical protein